jgi:hypothetical protein
MYGQWIYTQVSFDDHYPAKKFLTLWGLGTKKRPPKETPVAAKGK